MPLVNGLYPLYGLRYDMYLQVVLKNSEIM